MSSFLTEDRRPEAIGDGGGARKLRTFSGKDSGEVAMEWNEIEGLSEGLSHSAHQNRMEEIKISCILRYRRWDDGVDGNTCTVIVERVSLLKVNPKKPCVGMSYDIEEVHTFYKIMLG